MAPGGPGGPGTVRVDDPSENRRHRQQLGPSQAVGGAGLGPPLWFSFLRSTHCLTVDSALGPQTGASQGTSGQMPAHGNAQSRACLPAVTILPGAPGSPGRGGKGERCSQDQLVTQSLICKASGCI